MRRYLTASRLFVGAAALIALTTTGCATSGGPDGLPGLAGVAGSPVAGAALPSQATQPTIVSDPAQGQYSRGQMASFGRSGGSFNPLGGYSSGSASGGGGSLG